MGVRETTQFSLSMSSPIFSMSNPVKSSCGDMQKTACCSRTNQLPLISPAGFLYPNHGLQNKEGKRKVLSLNGEVCMQQLVIRKQRLSFLFVIGALLTRPLRSIDIKIVDVCPWFD